MFSLELMLIVFIAGFTQAILGFGFGLIFVSLGALFFSAKEVIPLSFFMGLFMDLFLVFNTYRYRPNKKIFDLVLMGIIGAPIGVFMFYIINPEVFEPILGAFLIFAIIILFLNKVTIPHTRFARIFAGFFTGVVGALLGVSGPFISIFLLSDRTLSRQQNIFVMNLYFIGITFVAFMVYVLSGAYRDLGVMNGVMLLSATAMGAITGLLIGQRLPKRWYRYCVYGMILVSAVFLIIPK